jgi:hypothetical protein
MIGVPLAGMTVLERLHVSGLCRQSGVRAMLCVCLLRRYIATQIAARADVRGG